jgi:DNA-binding transcriptional LysR family regulator
MNLRFLRTMIAIAEHPTFQAAGAAMGLSHSAVSLQVKALEEELRVALVDRSRRPPVLTDRGLALVEHARRMMEISDEIAALGDDAGLVGSLAVGAVPTELATLLPPALAALQGRHPRLRVSVRAELSDDLARLVQSRELDVAIVSESDAPLAGLLARPICAEPLFVIAHADAAGETDEELLRANPFILFSRRSWIGRQIERRLHERGIRVREVMEINSLEAVEAMVRNGLGVSIAPQRAGALAFAAPLKVAPFCAPQMARNVQLIEREANPRHRLTGALLEELRRLAGAD